MDPSHASYALVIVPKLMDQQFSSPEWQHRVTLAASREPWRRRAARRFGRLRMSASGVPMPQQVAVAQRRGR
jgi:hypothetical protein